METDSPVTAAVNPTSTATPTATDGNASKLGKLSESLKLEHQFLRVPFEHYKKTIRSNHRAVEKEVSAVISGIPDSVDSRDDAVQQITSLVSRLQGLKRKVV